MTRSQKETDAVWNSSQNPTSSVSGGQPQLNKNQAGTNAEDTKVPNGDDSFSSQTWLAGNLNNNIFQQNQKEIPMYHSVRGVPTYGLIFDPGASEALAGTQTVVEYCRDVLKPNGYDAEVIPSLSNNTSFVGIDGVPLASGVRLRLLCNLGPSTFHFETETIGASGDKCPFLLPNRSCIKHKMISMHGHFPNGDGLLILPEGGDNHTPIAIRLLLTDSGHYLVPLQTHFNNQE